MLVDEDSLHILLEKEPPHKPCLLLISETLGRLVDAKIFTQLGLRDGYLRYHKTIVRSAWKIPLCTRGHLESFVMPLGVANMPAKAYIYMERFWLPVRATRFDTCYVICLTHVVSFLVDIVICSSSAEEHELYVRLLWLRKLGLLFC